MNSSLKSGEIVSILRKEIEDFNPQTKIDDVGEVIQTGDGIARVFGLTSIMTGELVKIDIPGSNSVTGIALNLEEDNVGVVLLDHATSVKEGYVVRRTGSVAEVPVGEALLGRVIDPLGRPLDGGPAIVTDTQMPIECKGPGIIERVDVCEPLYTGIKAIDALIPIGKGQRELIIGDRRTGKTAICIDAIINQKNGKYQDKVYCFYVAIGQKQSAVVRIVDKLKEHGALEYTTVICASAADSAPLQYISPYAACAMAEYFMNSGRHALIVYDDLTKHAQAYREISLLLRRPPGREAYPGDIFYLHSRLLERAAKLSPKNGSGSMTALPIVETQAGDISAYIPTNVISITDGQIFLETNLFNSGLRPAINAGVSVSRVGGDAQIKAMKQTAGTLRLDLAQFRELASFSQFSSDLDKATKSLLDRGERLTEILKQKQYEPQEILFQIMIIFAGTNGYLDKYPVAKLGSYERHLKTYLTMKCSDFMNRLRKEGQFTAELNKEAKKILDDFINVFDPISSRDEVDAGFSSAISMAIAETYSLSRGGMINLIERATAKELMSPTIEEEIDSLLDNREESEGIKKDIFDIAVESCLIQDIEDKISMDDLFSIASQIIAEQTSLKSKFVLEKLFEREKSSSTAITPAFAVPHLILPDAKKLILVIFRSKKGIFFSEQSPAVPAIFFLAGTMDERKNQLFFVAAIVQIVSSPTFVEEWKNAKSIEELRTILLSHERKRLHPNKSTKKE